MKLAILSESSADESALRILADAILERRTEPVAPPRLQSRGWPAVLQVMPAVIKHLHYHTDAEALVVVADANHSPPHQGPVAASCAEDRCRLCLLRNTALRIQRKLSPVPGKERLKVAVGLAVPAIEAWYLAGKKSGVSEAAWAGGLKAGSFPYTRNKLKRDVYGTDRPSIELETRRAVEEARRLAVNLASLDQKFPIGFGLLSQSLSEW